MSAVALSESPVRCYHITRCHIP